MIRIILIRHGRTAWNVDEGQGERFRGLTDLPLAEEGVAQAQITARRLANTPLTAIYSSPLQRAFRTAQIIAEPHGLAVHPLPGLGSMNYGEWAGRTYAEVASRWPELYQKWRHDPFSIRIPGGESTVELRDRAVAAVQEVLNRHRDGETIVLISHQVVTRTLVCTLAGLPNVSCWRVRQDLCNLSRFDYEPTTGTFVVVGLNDTCHLRPTLTQGASRGLRIVLVRHGQTAWNAPLDIAGAKGGREERFRGHTDLPLDDTGHDQARAVAERLKNETFTALYTSPLLRARQTLAPLAEALGLPVQPHSGLLDVDYGDFQGLSVSETAAAYPELYTLWRTAPGRVRFPGGESLAEVQIRLQSLLDELATRHPGGTVALVGHQIVNKVLACTLLGLDLDQIWRVQMDTAGVSVFEQVDGIWYTHCLNDTCHLR